MKFSKQLRFAALSVVCMSALASCIKDPVGGGLPDADLKATKLSISLPGIQNGMKTRFGAPSAYDNINNLNIFITAGNNILHSLYISSTGEEFVASGDDEGITGEKQSEGNYVVTYPGEWLDAKDGVHRRGANNYIVVANYGSAIDVATVTDLREIEVGSDGGQVDPGKNVMFGESGMEVTMNPDGLSGNKSVKLERIAAMITLVIDGSGLKPGLTITPVEVSLHNVPTASYIGQRNIVTTQPGGTTPRTGAVSPNGETWPVRLEWEPITSANGIRGKHYDLVDTEIDGRTIKVPDFSTENVSTALFMYENYHGEDFGATGVTGAVGSQHQKRPYAAAGTTEAQINAVAGACSYLQVTARYNDNNSNYGEITYRVFLGANEFDDFNILRNHYYLVTLNLTGTGIGEGDASWRLATNLSTQGVIISDSDFTLNGGGEMIVIDAAKADNNASLKITYDGGASNWVYMLSSDGSWVQLSETGKFPIRDGKIYLYVQPMIKDVTWNGPGHTRSVRFFMRQASANNPGDAGATPYMTITQYEPVAIPLNQYSQFTSEIEALGWSTAGTLYIDRVDYEDPLPWGFDGTAIAAGITDSGFTNGDNLMVNYGGAAANYLPQGKDGSAMMHAAFMRYYQRTGVPTGMYPLQNLSIPDILGYSPPVNSNLPYNFAIPSVKEWELLNMINNINEIQFPEGQPIHSFVPYWTSTAVEDSDTQSYEFNLDGMIEGGKTPKSRTTPTRYRMIHYRP